MTPLNHESISIFKVKNARYWWAMVDHQEYAKFRRSDAILGLLGLVPSYHRAIVPSWVLRWSKTFSRGYFAGPRYFLVGISWVQSFPSWVYRGSKIFFRGYFVGPKFSLVSNFVNFSCWPQEKKWHRNISQTPYSIPNRSQQLWILLILIRYFIY